MVRAAILSITLLLMTVSPVFSQWSSGRPDGHAPIGVMGDHTHGKGEVMFSYRYMYMNMDGNRNDTESLTTDEVLDSYMVTPTQMPMQMHMFGIMYAVSDNLTLMGMVNLLQNEMDHATRMSNPETAFTTESSGLGDISLTGLITLGEFGNQRVHAHAGVSIPTGSIEEMDVTPVSAPNETILPYPMQLGSGTFDLLPGITYLGQKGDVSWGSQAKAEIRLGENDNDYALGNRLKLNSWLGLRATDWFAPTLRLEMNTWGDISGADSRLNPNMIHTADPDLKAGTRVDLGLGTNFFIYKGPLKDVRLAAEFGLPFYQNLEGPQMETDWTLMLGLQYTM